MDLIEPSSFNAIVIGSGLPEAMMASALAKAGKTVLLVDQSDHYGGLWSTVSWNGFLEGMSAMQSTPAGSIQQADDIIPLLTPHQVLSYQQFHSRQSIEHEHRFYLLDLNPKVLYQAEPLVDGMVRSSIHNYVEFKLLEANCMLQGGVLKPVPASKSDIFKSKDLTLADKRSMMQFLNRVMSESSLQDPDPPLSQLLSDAKLPDNLKTVILHGIVMADTHTHTSAAPSTHPTPPNLPISDLPSSNAPHTSSNEHQPERKGKQQLGGSSGVAEGTADSKGVGDGGADEMTAAMGLSALKLYMESMGRHGGRGAFMVPVYGSGSIVEGYVRAAAVSGAVTVLRHPLAGFTVDDARERCTGVVTGSGQRLESDHLVACPSVLRALAQASSTSTSEGGEAERIISRAVAVLNSPLQGCANLAVVFPPGSLPGVRHTVRALQLGASTCVTQAGRYLLYLVTEAQSSSAAADLTQALRALTRCEHLTEIRDSGEATAAGGTAIAAHDESQSKTALEGSSSDAGAGGGGEPGVAAGTTDGSSGGGVLSTGGVGGVSTPTNGGSGDNSSAGGTGGTQGATEGNDASPKQSDCSTTAAAAAVHPVRTGQDGSTGDDRPEVLHAVFYQQRIERQLPRSCLPGNVLCCPGVDPGLMGYVNVLEQCEALFTAHFPDVPWLPEVKEEGWDAGDGEVDALDDLMSAIGQITTNAPESGSEQAGEHGSEQVGEGVKGGEEVDVAGGQKADGAQ